MQEATFFWIKKIRDNKIEGRVKEGVPQKNCHASETVRPKSTVKIKG